MLNTFCSNRPNANATTIMIINYVSMPCRYSSPLQGIQKYISSVTYVRGCSGVKCSNQNLFATVVKVTTSVDAVVLVVGLDKSIEAEGLDRVILTLHGFQEKLVTNVASATKGTVVLVIMTTCPIDISFTKSVSDPTQNGGNAITQVIFGEFKSCGRSPFTWYP